MADRSRILIADDDAGLVKALATRLEHAGYEVVTASDGYSALARAVETKPDLMILDVHMPAGDGFSVQDRQSQYPELARTPVIYVTGHPSADCRIQAHEHHAAAFLRKPIEIEDLLAVIDRALSIETT